LKQRNVYILKTPGFYKIGIAADIQKRLRTLRTGNPFGIEVVFSAPVYDAYGIESKLHRQFKNKRKSGEWFALTDDEAQLAKALLRAYADGEPKPGFQLSFKNLLRRVWNYQRDY